MVENSRLRTVSSVMPLQEKELSALLSKLHRTPSNAQLHWHAKKILEELVVQHPTCWEVYQPVMTELLAILFCHNAVNHCSLSSLAVGQLKRKYHIDAETEPATSQTLLHQLAHDLLFLATLEKTCNVDNEFEIFLRKLRRSLLFAYRANPAVPETLLRLVAASAHQGFNNEYIFHEEEDEQKLVDEMTQQWAQAMQSDSVAAHAILLLVIGMYRPIVQLPGIDQLAALPRHTFSEGMRAALVRMVYEPLEERRLLAEIPSFGKIRDPTSHAVRAQYEENPYPRWFQAGGPFVSLETKLTNMSPGFRWPAAFDGQPLHILVAGCGTGQYLVRLAAGNPDAKVVAIDLSRTSLAYAKRQVNRSSLDNITFWHGDILDLLQLGRRFHHIECFGVLHHMKDSVAGWRALESVLLPGGTLHIGVYSQVARLPVTLIRRHITRCGLQPIPHDMKQFRYQLLTQKRYARFLNAFLSYDFYTLSSFRDLFFHSHEHGYTLSEIRHIIDDLQLTFLGFRLDAPALHAQYRTCFPDDPALQSFAHWQQFESNYAGSMQLFCLGLQKPLA